MSEDCREVCHRKRKACKNPSKEYGNTYARLWVTTTRELSVSAIKFLKHRFWDELPVEKARLGNVKRWNALMGCPIPWLTYKEYHPFGKCIYQLAKNGIKYVRRTRLGLGATAMPGNFRRRLHCPTESTDQDIWNLWSGGIGSLLVGRNEREKCIDGYCFFAVYNRKKRQRGFLHFDGLTCPTIRVTYTAGNVVSLLYGRDLREKLSRTIEDMCNFRASWTWVLLDVASEMERCRWKRSHLETISNFVEAGVVFLKFQYWGEMGKTVSYLEHEGLYCSVLKERCSSATSKRYLSSLCEHIKKALQLKENSRNEYNWKQELKYKVEEIDQVWISETITVDSEKGNKEYSKGDSKETCKESRAHSRCHIFIIC